MALADDLLDVASGLIPSGPGRSSQARLRRAISTAYYSVFHALAKSNADLLVAARPGVLERAWAQAYRALQHAAFEDGKRRKTLKTFPATVQTFVDKFEELRRQRLRADYDPNASFTRSDAIASIIIARHALLLLGRQQRRDLRALAVLTLLPQR
jgi:hypothetical protein